ncbi:mucin-5AC [Malaya genurostris]|uniref:mucin-5AC n=1 Tax=Malaya genurostris TaxID=325434 RepID=UPI0026F3E9A4|nr:mucin-5AC [Malaya genurostris]XP_058467307.1 mucin-5AC [Malaya genurostris]XP_058467308.1 mucin-5AC [Malaya genurostris]
MFFGIQLAKMELVSKMFLSALLLTTVVISSGQLISGPRYSLDNMPKTSFSCRDKILGGYYADSETQCQMFHVCVKVAGVGVQDFRFLCPNGTAFDQEAQICADWGDVDCEAATLYYGSNNFDLYRIGSGFESKRAPYAEEEEATFHLQRAETSDARRSKQYIVNQSSKPQGPPVHNPNQFQSVQKPQYRPPPTQTTTTTTSTTPQPSTTSSSSANENYYNNQYQKQIQQKHLQHKQQQLIYNQQQQIQQQQYRQLTAAAATATPAERRQHDEVRSTTPTNFANNQKPQQQRNDHNNDEILRGSHSSNFFNNRNNGKEDLEDDFQRKSTSSSAIQKAPVRPLQSAVNSTRTQQRGRNRGRGTVRAHNLNVVRNEIKPTPPRQTHLQSTTPEDFVDVAKIPNFNRNNNNFRQQPTTVLQPHNSNQINFEQSSPSTPAPFSRGARPVQNFGTNHSSNAFFNKQQTNTTPKQTPVQHFQQYQTTPAAPHGQQYQTPISPSNRANEQFKYNNNQQHASQPNPPTTTHAPNINFQFFNRIQPTDFRPSSSSTTSTVSPPSPQNVNRVTQAPQLYNTGFEHKATERAVVESTVANQDLQRARAQSRVYNVDPGRLSQFNYNEYQGSRASVTTSTTAATTTIATENVTPSTYNPVNYRPQQKPQQIRNHPQSFNQNPFDPRTTTTASVTTSTTTLRPVTNERYQIISRSASDGHTPSTIKKFSTLVPKDQYNPTTFKPNAFSKKALLQFIVQKPEKVQEKPIAAPVKSTLYIPTVPPLSTTTTTTTAAPASRRQSTSFFQQPQKPIQPIISTTTQRSEDINEDDGQYHPELYEKDFYRNRVKAKFNQERKQNQDPLSATRKQSFQQSPVVSQSLSAASDEDEIFRTAHSQNIAASGNDLILERARQAAVKINEFLSSSSVKPTVAAPTKRSSQSSADNQQVNPKPFSKAPTISPHATSTKRPSDDKDEYDYAYYDTGSPDVPEYDVIEEFGRTSKKNSNRASEKRQRN